VQNQVLQFQQVRWRMRLMKNIQTLLPFFLAICFIIFAVPISQAQEDAPEVIRTYLNSKPHKLGEDTYRKFGFGVYRISLWVAGDGWDQGEPYALALHYFRGVSKETMVDTIIGNIRDEHVADEAALARWEKMLHSALPPVEDGDELVGLALPGKKTLLFYNSVQIAAIHDKVFSDAFFNIWLGQNADEDMRNRLFGVK